MVFCGVWSSCSVVVSGVISTVVSVWCGLVLPGKVEVVRVNVLKSRLGT